MRGPDYTATSVIFIPAVVYAAKTATTATSSAGVAGSYSLAGVLAGYDYRVTPDASAVYAYTPPRRLYTNLSSAQSAQNFKAARKAYNVAGKVVRGGTTNGAGGVTMTPKNSCGALVRTVTTRSDGTYSTPGVPAGVRHLLTPAKSGMSFTPDDRSYTNLSSNKSAQNFQGT